MTVAYDLSSKTAVVTGGAKGIGRAIAERLARSGARVWVWDISACALDGISSLVVDVTDSDQIASAVAQTLNQNSEIDVLVNDAGYLGGYQPFERFKSDECRRIVEVNLDRRIRGLSPKCSRTCGGLDGVTSSTWVRLPEKKVCPIWRRIRLRAQR